MSINAIQNSQNAVNFGEEPKQNKTSTMGTPGFITGAIAGGAVGYGLKSPMTFEKLAGLEKDVFDKVPEDKANSVKELKKQIAKANGADAKAEEQIKEAFPKAEEEGKVTAKDYLKYIGQESKETLETALNEAKNAEESDTKKATIDKLTSQKTILEGATEVKDGEVSTIEKSKIKEGFVKDIKAEAEKAAKSSMDELKDLIKAHSGKTALIGAGIGAVVLGIIGHCIGESKPAEAAPEVAPETPAQPEAPKV